MHYLSGTPGEGPLGETHADILLHGCVWIAIDPADGLDILTAWVPQILRAIKDGHPCVRMVDVMEFLCSRWHLEVGGWADEKLVHMHGWSLSAIQEQLTVLIATGLDKTTCAWPLAIERAKVALSTIEGSKIQCFCFSEATSIEYAPAGVPTGTAASMVIHRGVEECLGVTFGQLADDERTTLTFGVQTDKTKITIFR